MEVVAREVAVPVAPVAEAAVEVEEGVAEVEDNLLTPASMRNSD